MMSYCSEAHQREDWKDVHKIECPALKYTATRKMSREVRRDLANTRRCIGEMYRDGLGTARNKKLAADYLAKSRLLAESRHTSEGIALNNENKYYAAMKHLQRGVDEDDCSEAMFYIASLHFYGRGTAVDRHEAFKWYLRAADATSGEGTPSPRPKNERPRQTTTRRKNLAMLLQAMIATEDGPAAALAAAMMAESNTPMEALVA